MHATGERIWPSVAPNSTIGCLSGALSTVFGARGPCLTISAACISSAAAVALAAQQILAGTVDVALAGGAEAPLRDLILAQLQSAGVLASHSDPRLACRPFDRARNGTVIGEGAAFLVLESLASARKRGARIRARLAGWAMGSDGGERTGISGDSECLRRNMNEALALAHLSAADLDYVNAHGTGTELNDRMEARAIGGLAGENTRLVTSSTKAVTGHSMGAVAAIDALISVLALERQSLPPSTNCFAQASDCPIALVAARPARSAVNVVLSHSAGFWGNHASLIFTRPPDA
jgi:3-oxoacyl-(acyl-carrier-protein) synthase